MLYIKKKGSIDYTIVGTPTIVDGVVSGFSSGNYLTLPNWTDEGNDLEIAFAFSLPEGYPNYERPIYRFGAGTYENWILVNSYKRGITARITSTETISINYNMQLNTNYIAKLKRASGVYTLYLLDASNNVLASDLLTSATLLNNGNSASMVIGYEANIYGTGFPGTIDLNETYIMVDGQPWFGICPVEVKKHQIMGPVGYELSGNATVTDGILTGVDSSSSCGTSIILPSDFNELEFVFKARRYSWTAGSTSQILTLCGWAAGSGSTRRITTNSASGEGQGTRVFNGSSQIVNIDNSRFDVTAYTNSGYYTRLRVIKNENDYTYELGLSGDKQVWVTASANYSTNICTQKLWLLRNSSGSTSSTGEMDLNETYAKVDGKIWFWQPRETERIVVNGVEVWNKNEV